MWGGTRPPISGCLQIIMDCRTRGSRKRRERAMEAFWALMEARAKEGFRWCR